MAEELEEHGGDVAYRGAGKVDSLCELQVKGGAAEDREPYKCQQRRYEQRAENELPNRAAPGYACNEQPHKG